MDQKYWEYVQTLYQLAVKDDVTIGVNKLKEEWQQNKSWMAPYFDEQGWRSKLITREPSTEDIYDAFKEGKRIGAAICTRKKYQAIGDLDNGVAAIDWVYNSLLDYEFSVSELINNATSSKKPYPGKEGKELPVGTKVTKLVQLIAVNNKQAWQEELGKYGVENQALISNFLIDVLSQIISILKTNGITVVLSINPFDFMMAAIHTSGKWLSCHNIYRGWVTYAASMICHKHAVIAFAYKKSLVVDGTNILWPQRIWRSHMCFDEDSKSFLLASQYPNKNQELANMAREIGIEFLAERFREPAKTAETRIEGIGYILKNTIWTHVDLVNFVTKLKTGSYITNIDAGSKQIPCLKCGETRKQDPDISSIYNYHLCLKCSNEFVCKNCHSKYKKEHRAEEPYQEYCEYCVNKCAVCGRVEVKRYNDNYSPALFHDRAGRVLVCRECSKSLLKCHHCGNKMDLLSAYKTKDYGTIYCTECVQQYSLKNVIRYDIAMDETLTKR